MEAIETNLPEANLIFSWPYKFYSTQHIQKEYNASHDRKPVDIMLDEEKNLFHLTSNYDDLEFHSDKFRLYIDAYIQRELETMHRDLISGEAPQVKQLWTTVNQRSRFFDRARQDHHVEDLHGDGQLIVTEKFKKTIHFNDHSMKEKYTNKKLFDTIAKGYECALIWQESGLQILSNDRINLMKTLDSLTPIVALLDGVCVNSYWVDSVAGLQFRFMRLARAADHSVYKFKDFSATHYDLHSVRWDTSSLQHITLRPKALSDIEYPRERRNPWHKYIECHYGAKENAPDQWMDPEILNQTLSSNFMPPEQLNSIKSWMTSIGELRDPEAQPEGSTVPSASAESDQDLAGIWAEGKRVEQGDIDRLVKEVKKTDIEERRRLLDDLDLDRPRVRPAPRLKAASKAPSATSSVQSGKQNDNQPDFINVLVNNFTKLVTTIKLQTHEESACVIKIGQIFTSSASIPHDYRLDGNRASEVFAPAFWDKLFTKEAVETKPDGTYFSSRLTSSDDDALFMSETPLKDTKPSKGSQTVFQRRAWSDRTSYRLRCKNISTGTVAILEIDHQHDVSIKALEREIGYVNIHFPEYWWDARVSCSLISQLPESDIQAFSRLLSTVWIGNSENGSYQGETLYGRKEADIKILSCQHRRERIHETTEDLPDEKGIYLHITRVEELYMANILSTSGGFCAFGTSTDLTSEASEAHPDSDQRLWYEAYVHSESIDSSLPEPTDLAPYPRGMGTDEVFILPEHNEPLKRILRSELATLFNATHNLVTEWNSVGSKDRARAPVNTKSGSKMTGLGGTGIDGSSASAMAASRGKGKNEA